MKTKIISILMNKVTLAVFTISALCLSGITLASNQNKIDLVTPEEEYRIVSKQFFEFQELKNTTLKRFEEEEKEKRLNVCLATKALANAKELAHINGEAVLSPEDLERVQSKTKWSCF